MFTGHVEITDKTAATPFEQYLYIEQGYGETCRAYGIGDDTPLDIDALLQAAFPEQTISTERSMCGDNYAAIITDNRAPDSVVVWQSTDFYFD